MTEHDLRAHLLNIPSRLKRSALVFACCFCCLLPIGISKGIDTFWYPPLAFGLLMALITFFGHPKAFFNRRKSLQQLEESGLMQDALADFQAAEDFGKCGRIGQRFFFGFDTGIVVEIAQITRVYTDKVKRHGDGTTNLANRYARMVLTTGEEKIMCCATGSYSATQRLKERIEALHSPTN